MQIANLIGPRGTQVNPITWVTTYLKDRPKKCFYSCWQLTLRMPTVWTLVVLLLFLGVLEARFVSAKSREKPCGHVSTFVLMEILGPAFNYRYMRLDTPSDFDEEIEIDFKRDTQKKYDSFYVTDPYALEVSKIPFSKTSDILKDLRRSLRRIV